MQKITAWILDVYPDETGMVIWLIDKTGRHFRTHHHWQPTLHLQVAPPDERAFAALIRQYSNHLNIKNDRKYDVFHKWQKILTIKLSSPLILDRISRQIQKNMIHSLYWQGNLDPAQMYLYENGLFCLAYCEFHLDNNNEITKIILKDDREATEFAMPPLKTINIKTAGRKTNPKHALLNDLEIEYEGQTIVLEKDEPRQMLETLDTILKNYDPDIIFSRYGDSYIFPRLDKFCQQARFPLSLNRDTGKNTSFGREHTYFTYGKIVHRAGIASLFGRLHIDQRNSFLYRESNLEGIIELARLSSIPVQKMARSSIGTAMSSMEYVVAYKNDIIIPTAKQEPEDFKSGEAHLLSDKGGLVFMPNVGFHENVSEIDFASMYPTIMVKFNISPETINCDCCPDAPTVPEIGYRICQKQKGIIPETLAPILKKRAYYKELQKKAEANNDIATYNKYYLRQNALKWILVTCFGYLGYKNARFGKIDAHESVTAYGREILLQAKDIAESEGHEFLHAIVDSLWLKHESGHHHVRHNGEFCEIRLQNLCDRISNETKIPISLEGNYKWICFVPSKMDSKIGAANRYYGCFENDTLKIRGIEARRHDTPPLINDFQLDLLAQMSKHKNVKAIQKNLPKYWQQFEDLLHNLFDGEIDVEDLVISKNLSRDPDSFAVETHTAIAAKEMLGRGMKVGAGDQVQYIITDAESEDRTSRVRCFGHMDADWAYDAKKYGELLIRSFTSLFSCFGYDDEYMLKWYKDWINKNYENLHRHKRLELSHGPKQMEGRLLPQRQN
ncbi:hypothetical protein KKC88_05390 [Patescibacteria group bacterium]|nr:hypothetical protein [Patescibacteria group bacterium]MBU1673055.1 hypothetical protein [Patescibacteria group bacterium]MBU1963661.1 hypothetical protein [Patescibacteria group bacterium]